MEYRSHVASSELAHGIYNLPPPEPLEIHGVDAAERWKSSRERGITIQSQ